MKKEWQTASPTETCSERRFFMRPDRRRGGVCPAELTDSSFPLPLRRLARADVCLRRADVAILTAIVRRKPYAPTRPVVSARADAGHQPRVQEGNLGEVLSPACEFLVHQLHRHDGSRPRFQNLARLAADALVCIVFQDRLLGSVIGLPHYGDCAAIRPPWPLP